MKKRYFHTTAMFCLTACLLCFHGAGQEEDKLKTLQAMEIEELLNIKVVTASKSRESAASAPSVISVLTRKEIDDINPANLSELLNTIPNFNIQIRNLGEAMFQVRGIASVHDTILLMIDGHPLNDRIFQTVTYIINSIPVDEIERIEVIRGPGSSIYGANAFYAVVNIITLKGSPNSFARVSGRAASEGACQVTGVGRKETETSHILAAGTCFASDGIEVPFTDRSKTAGETNFPQDREHLYVNAGKGRFGFSALYNREKLGPYVGIAYILNDRTDRRYTTSAVEGRAEFDLADRWKLSGKVYGDSFVYDCFWEYTTPPITPPNGTLTSAYARDYRVGTEWNLNVDFSKRHRLLAGFTFDRIGLTGSRASDNLVDPFVLTPTPGSWISNATENNTALYVQDNYFIKKWLQVVLGFRFDYHSYYGGSFNPRCALTGDLGSRGHFKLIYSQAFHAPSFWDLFGNSPDQVWNPDLKPEKLKSFEGEFGYKLSKSLLLRCNFFHNEISDLIAKVIAHIGDVDKYIKTNLGKIRVDGAEVELDGNLQEGKTWFKLSAFWNHSRNADTNADIPWTPRLGAGLVLSHELLPRWNATLSVKCLGKMLREPGDPRPSLAPTAVVDISSHYTFSWLTLKFAVHDLLDAGVVSPSPNGKLLQDYPHGGRSFRFALEYNFNRN